MNAPQGFLNMTAETLGKDLLGALVTEIKLLPEPWHKLSKAKQDDIIDRLRKRVESNVKMAVHLLAAEGRVTIAGDLDQITIKDGGGMDGESVQGEVIEGEVLGLPSPDSVTPTQDELDEAWESGYQTAADGKPESDCPVMKGALCIAWVKGWKAWHEQNPANDESDEKKAA